MDLTQDMIICSAYRYAIGRSSYITTLANDIPKKYYKEFSDDRKEFITKDIRSILLEKINCYICNFTINRIDSISEFNPISALLNFIKEKEIKSIEEFCLYDDIVYNADNGKYTYSKLENSNRYIDIMFLDDLIPWEIFASCFDINNYRYINNKAYFKSWRRSYRKDKLRGVYIQEKFKWEEQWVDLDSFLSDETTISYDESSLLKLEKDE